MAGWRYCADTAPHDGHQWSRSDDVAEPVSGGREVWTTYYYCPGVNADSEIVRLLDQIELKELELEAVKEKAREYALTLRRTECDFMNNADQARDCAEGDLEKVEINGGFCFGCPRSR